MTAAVRRSDGREYCNITKVTKSGELRCDLPLGHVGATHATALINPLLPGKVAFIHEWEQGIVTR
jgi:hypothetical protein